MGKKLDREISEAAKKIILTGVLSVAMFVGSVIPSKIGRASCRERVFRAV